MLYRGTACLSRPVAVALNNWLVRLQADTTNSEQQPKTGEHFPTVAEAMVPVIG